ncbi:MAG: hypothetical protein ACRETZ_11900 [Steroidobacteraceae bacterium]
MPHWTTRLELLLAEPAALRVLDRRSIMALAEDARPGVSEPTVERWIQDAVSADRLRRVVRGLYLNRLISPPAQLAEAAVWLRPGAVISLQTVLGDAGAWNNYTRWVTAVVPLSRRYPTPSLGKRETVAGTLVFRGIPERVLEAGREGDRLLAGLTYRRATPEAALLHWLYLSHSPRSRMSEPPSELDFDSLEAQKLKRLARAMNLSEELDRWRAQPGGTCRIAGLDVLKQMAAKYIWWKTPDEAMHYPRRVITQVMNIGDYGDVQGLVHALGEEALKKALRGAEAGEFSEKSWVYWHLRLRLCPVEEPCQPMPVRRVQ